MTKNERQLREQVVRLLTARQAHATLEDAVRGFPVRLAGRRPKGAEHTAWQLLEHIRIAQFDILDFCRNPQYRELRFPEDYWPRSPAPPSAAAWQRSVRAARRDLAAMVRLVRDRRTDLFVPIPHGTGQNVLREALLVADHNAYHVGQLVMLRRLLGAW
jgi:uncharacterized damage-inducible protein DinB